MPVKRDEDGAVPVPAHPLEVLHRGLRKVARCARSARKLPKGVDIEKMWELNPGDHEGSAPASTCAARAAVMSPGPFGAAVAI